MKVIGTAGHIDHGKSTLVRSLTGIDPDRLEEEKRRGMTIDLGFAPLTLPSGVQASIVDVPGHERFIKTMLAGATGVDVALLVVASDEGVMPQTREHLDILSLLGITHGVVALTKSDLVEHDLLQLASEDALDSVQASSLRGCPIIPVSAVTGDGLPELMAALESAILASTNNVVSGRPFLPIDRVFSVPGFGPVVTGTLHAGTFTQGADAIVMPQGKRVRMRGLQMHNRSASVVEPGSRVAINLTGIETADLQRGDVVAAPGAVLASSTVDVRLQVLPTAPIPLHHGMHVMVHVGSAESDATIWIPGGTHLYPGAAGWIRLHFERPLAVTRDQTVVVRLPAPARTVGGGPIVDAEPRNRRLVAAAGARLGKLSSLDPRIRVLGAADAARPTDVASIAFRAGLPVTESHAIVQSLMQTGEFLQLQNAVVTREYWLLLVERSTTILRAYHERYPLHSGMPKEELRARLRWSHSGWSDLVTELARRGVIEDDGAVVRLPEYRGGTSVRQNEADSVISLLESSAYSPPTKSVLIQQTGADDDLLHALVRDDRLVRVDRDLYFARQHYDAIKALVVETIRANGSITVSGLRDALGTSRKAALSLLEYLDSERVTRRVGDARVIGSNISA